MRGIRETKNNVLEETNSKRRSARRPNIARPIQKELSQTKLVRSPYQTCAEVLSLLRTHTGLRKWTSKRTKSMVRAVRKRMRGAPEPGAPAPATGHPPRIPFLTTFTIDFWRFEGHFCCPVWVLRRDSFWGRVWYGLRTNLP